MPVYEYECQKCGHVTEALRKMSDADAAIACEKCGNAQTHRSHSVFAAGASDSPAASLPMGGGGGCCPCGDPGGPCNS